MPRPFWSIMIPTYNSGAFLDEALASVLAEDEGPERMQIMVVDDASDRDDPEALVARLGRGRVQFLRQERNVGHIANFHTCLAASRGLVVHLLHGDDLVEPGFYRALGRGMASDERIGAAFCTSRFIDAAGEVLGSTEPLLARPGPLPSPAEQLARQQHVMTPSMVVRRTVYEALGGFDRRLACSEDWEMWVRIAADYPIWHDPRPLARYRMHAGSNTGRHIAAAEDMAFTRRAMEIFSAYLPHTVRDDILREARRTYAGTALGMARTLLRDGQRHGARAQLREALLFDHSPATLRAAARVMAASLVPRSERRSMSETSRPCRVAITGCGAVTRLYYAPALAELAARGEIALVGAFDPVRDSAAAIARQHHRARVATDMDELLALDAELVIVASPPTAHAGQTIAALESGASVLCEKPFAPTLAAAEAMVDVAASTGRSLSVGHIRRHFPAARAIRDILEFGPDRRRPRRCLLRGRPLRLADRQPTIFLPRRIRRRRAAGSGPALLRPPDLVAGAAACAQLLRRRHGRDRGQLPRPPRLRRVHRGDPPQPRLGAPQPLSHRRHQGRA